MKIDWSIFWTAVSAIGTVVALLAFGVSFIQWSKAQKVKRIELLFLIMDKFIENDDVLHAMEMIDYEVPWYFLNFHDSSNLEQKSMDKLFTLMNNLAILANSELLKNEIKPFEYHLLRLLKDEQVQHYLWNLYHFSKRQNIQSVYHALIEYGLKKNYINKKKFDSKESFEKYLNF